MIATQDTLSHPRQESRTTTSGWSSTTGWCSAPAGTTTSRGANLARASRSSSGNEKAPHRWTGVRRERQSPRRVLRPNAHRPWPLPDGQLSGQAQPVTPCL